MTTTRTLQIIINQAGNAETGLKGILKTLGPIGVGAAAAVAGIAAVGVGMTAFVAGGIDKAAALDQQIADIASIMNKAKEDIEPLKDLVMDLALNPKLKVETAEAADAVQMLARNGLDMQKILDGAALSTVALANATGANFGVAADVATDVMALFNVEAAEMESAIDGITGVTTNSKFTIDDYALALAQAGGVAAGMGVSLEDFNAVIAGISPSFASGSDAGTSFKTMLQRLANPTSEMQALMDELGLSLFDANGEMRPMADVVEQLNSAFGGMTEAQRANTAAILGGSDAARVMLAVGKLSREEFEALTEQVNAQGQAFGAAATRMDTVSGAMEILQGAVEGMQLQMGDALLPLIKDLVMAFTEIADTEGPKVVELFSTLATEHGPAMVASLTALLEKAPAMIEFLANMAVKFSEISSSEVPATFERISTATTQLSDLLDRFNAAWDRTAAVLFGAKEKTDETSGAFASIIEFIRSMPQPLDITIGAFNLLLDVWEAGIDTLELFKTAFDTLNSATATGTEKFNAFKAALASLFIPWFLRPGSPSPMENSLRGISSALEPLNRLLGSMRGAMSSLSGTLSSVANRFNDMASAARNAVNSIPSWLRPGSPTPFEIGLRGIAGAAKNVGAALPAAFGGVGGPGLALTGAGSAGGGGQVVVNLHYAPAVSTADELELERVLTSVVNRINRKL